MTGNHPETDGNQSLWSFSNNITLSAAPFGSSFTVLWIEAN